MFSYNDEHKININDIIFFPDKSSENNFDNNSFLSSSNKNILECQEMDEKWHYDISSSIDCNQKRSYYENKDILAFFPQENNYKRNIMNNQINLFDNEDDINIDKCYYTNSTGTKTNINHKYLFTIKRKRDIKKNLDINHLGRKFGQDNIISKIKVSYTNCTIDLFNEIIKSKNIEKIKFYHIDHDISKITNKKEQLEMKTGTIEKFISKKTSKKYCQNENNNFEMCRIIKKDEKLEDIAKLLNLNFLFFFDKIYHQKRKEIYRLSDYGLDDIVFKLPKKTQLYDDLLEKNKDETLYEKYKTEMEICCKINFNLDDKIPKFKIKKSKRKNI